MSIFDDTPSGFLNTGGGDADDAVLETEDRCGCIRDQHGVLLEACQEHRATREGKRD